MIPKPPFSEVAVHEFNHAAIKRQPQCSASMNPRGLSAREQEVLGLLHLSNLAIAELMGISPNTVKRYAFSAYMKLGAENRTQAAMLYRDMQEREVA